MKENIEDKLNKKASSDFLNSASHPSLDDPKSAYQVYIKAFYEQIPGAVGPKTPSQV